jgi:PcfJ-like protein
MIFLLSYLSLFTYLNFYFSKYHTRKFSSTQENTSECSVPQSVRRRIIALLIGNEFELPSFLTGKEKTLAENIIVAKIYFCEHELTSPSFFIAFLKKINENDALFERWINNYFDQLYVRYWKGMAYWYDSKAVRRIEDWKVDAFGNDLDAAFLGLIATLFEKYHVSASLRNAWSYWDFDEERELSVRLAFTEKLETDVQISDFVFFDWYFRAAQGGNLRKHPNLPFAMSKNAAFYFSQTPDSLSLMQAFRWAKSKGLGASDETAHFLAMEFPFFDQQEVYVEQITYLLMATTNVENVKLREVIRFLKVVAMGLPNYEYLELNAYFLQNLMPHFSLKGKTIASILRLKESLLKKLPTLAALVPAEIDWTVLLSQRENYSFSFRNMELFLSQVSYEDAKKVSVWKLSAKTTGNVVAALNFYEDTLENALHFRLNLLVAMQEIPVPAYPALQRTPDIFAYKAADTARYEVVRLSNYLELYEDGQAMNHCVASYDERCLMGTSSIWSLRQILPNQTLVRLATVEWIPEGKYIEQARAFDDSEPCKVAWQLLKEWEAFLLKCHYELPTTKALSARAVPL